MSWKQARGASSKNIGNHDVVSAEIQIWVVRVRVVFLTHCVQFFQHFDQLKQLLSNNSNSGLEWTWSNACTTPHISSTLVDLSHRKHTEQQHGVSQRVGVTEVFLTCCTNIAAGYLSIIYKLDIQSQGMSIQLKTVKWNTSFYCQSYAVALQCYSHQIITWCNQLDLWQIHEGLHSVMWEERFVGIKKNQTGCKRLFVFFTKIKAQPLGWSIQWLAQYITKQVYDDIV